MLKNIPRDRLLLYILIIGLLPLALVITNFLGKFTRVEELENEVNYVQALAIDLEQRQAINNAIIYHYSDADHFYVDKHLETLTFLKPEVDSLKKIVDNPNFAGDDAVTKRLEFLSGAGNALLFNEGSVVTYPQFQETIAMLVHPVEVNLHDIQDLLARVEGVNIGPYSPKPNRPQMIVLDFTLEKKEIFKNNEIFEVNIKVLKREYL